MSVLLQINRDFPFQVALSFDDAAIEVLEWLDDASFEWDMYVDLPADCVRYCFRTVADATAFKQRFGMRRKGELSPAAIDRGWPYQVALPARFCRRPARLDSKPRLPHLGDQPSLTKNTNPTSQK
jgi:hypothetical protein